jgi:hypothetical protein
MVGPVFKTVDTVIVISNFIRTDRRSLLAALGGAAAMSATSQARRRARQSVQALHRQQHRHPAASIRGYRFDEGHTEREEGASPKAVLIW